MNGIDKLTVGYRYLSFKSFLFHTKRLIERQITTYFNQRIAGLNVQAIVTREKEELDRLWANPDNRLDIAPGEEILTAVFHQVGSKYNKTSDAARIAKEMLPQEIKQELIDIIDKVRALADK